MRLWSLHPRFLDTKGLLALWREALLAQKVLAGGTRGYTRHPQLERFRAQPEPLAAIAAYLSAVRQEAVERGYRFRVELILNPSAAVRAGRIAVTLGQLRYEFSHLRRKLRERDPSRLGEVDSVLPALSAAASPEAGDLSRVLHPLFYPVAGDIEPWEKVPPQ